ncbi:MAG: beta-lactamase family protein [Gemmataceae bacterium]|nr:beta-lactamase family protein [Gemmataceae bacterium]
MATDSRRAFLRTAIALPAGVLLPGAVSADDPNDRFDWSLHEPETVGMSRDGLTKVREVIQKNIDEKVIAGAVTAVARHNKLVWFEAQGVRDAPTGAKMCKDDLFRMMSSTKPVVAVAVLIQMDRGKLTLDDPVSKFIPAFKGQKVAVAEKGAKDASGVKLVPAERDVTIKHLLTHTSGLSSGGDGSLVNTVERKPDDTLADYVPRLGAAALDFQPGTKFRYSPVDGFDTLLRIVEIASGKPADEFLRENLFKPLDMTDTSFNVPEAKKGRLVSIHSSRKDGFRVEKPLFGDGPWKYHSGAGGLFSTAHDYMQFEVMLLNKGSLNGKRVLKPGTVELMARNHVGKLFAEWFPPLTAGHGFGLGVRVVEDEAKGGGRGVGAFGWGGAYGTESWADPELGVAAVLFVQMQSSQPGVTAGFQQVLRKAIVK